MAALLKREDTAVPTPKDTRLATEASRVLARKVDGELRVKLEDGNELLLPKAATRLLSHILRADPKTC